MTGFNIAIVGFDGTLRVERPRRCALPITAFRVTCPRDSAICLAERPSPHNSLSSSTRSAVHSMLTPHDVVDFSSARGCRCCGTHFVRQRPLTYYIQYALWLQPELGDYFNFPNSKSRFERRSGAAGRDSREKYRCQPRHQGRDCAVDRAISYTRCLEERP